MRQVAPESELPIGVGDSDVVKFVGGAYRSVVIVFPLQKNTVERRHHPPASEPRSVMIRVGSRKRSVMAGPGANAVEKHDF